ncbi:uncharacterized protein N7496_002445 [Penicillium cataractarum]|uniref:Uncharacterized protein n=1 Tax=Penicillium cataractarum TaxID=2100454 RepID=A0A9W9SKA2_9EURO|nr:uncharacterized protein N7496_002445 [Penicillium cataractarum]KAJ5380017.1 hypothetical protein N7496_002445 [Penicillium cataractarum]
MHMISKMLERRSIGRAFHSWSVLAELAQVGKDSIHTWQEAKMQMHHAGLNAASNQPAYQQRRNNSKKGGYKKKYSMIGTPKPAEAAGSPRPGMKRAAPSMEAAVAAPSSVPSVS